MGSPMIDLNNQNGNAPLAGEANRETKLDEPIIKNAEKLSNNQPSKVQFIAPQFDNIPAELQKLERWLTWRAEGEPGEKPRKVPYTPNGSNKKGKSTDPQTWGTFQQAKNAFIKESRTGVGFVLNGDGIVGIDLDACVFDGVPSAEAMALLDGLGAAYIEVSPSGTGLRALGYGEKLESGVNGIRDGLKVEFYSTSRYLTLTGKTIKAGPLAQLVGFRETAESFRISKKTKANAKTGKQETVPPDARIAALLKAIQSGDVYHDSLRDLAASMIATGMKSGAVVNLLRGLMDASQGPHDDRWISRRAQIPDLVSSASAKFSPDEFEYVDPEPGEVRKDHPLAKFVTVGEAPKPPRWVIPGFIGHGVVVIAGAHGVGKTTALLPLAMTAAGLHGDALLPYEWRHVIYITEDVEQAQRIVSGITGCAELNMELKCVQERLHIVEAVRLDPDYVASVGKQYRERFTRNVDGVEVLPLVVLDTKSAVLVLNNENDNGEASSMMAALKQGFDGLPVWLIGHVAKANVNRKDVDGFSTRGASAVEADANQTIFLVREGEIRYLVVGKVRFEPKWHELAISSHTMHATAPDEFGNPENITIRWGIAAPGQQNRKQAAEQASAKQREKDAESLHRDIRDAVDVAWRSGNPLNRQGIKGMMKRNAATVVATMESLLSEGWLHEVEVPKKDRVQSRRSRYFISLTAEERDAVLKGEGPPPKKLVVPASWSRTGSPHVPDGLGTDDLAEDLNQ